MKQKSSKTTASRKKTKDKAEGGGVEETEITAQITIPQDGAWGWLVVLASFVNIFILDGVCFTFGSILPDMTKNLQQPEFLVALINSIALALYYIVSPMASALINRFGFRGCAMTGSVICSIALFSTYFATNYTSVILLYGVAAGCGYSLINMSCGLVVGFYFQRLRAVALSLSSCGSSLGISVLNLVNSRLVKLDGWRTTILLHSGLMGLIFYFSMMYRPLPSFTVSIVGDKELEAVRTVAYLPSVMDNSATTVAVSHSPDSTHSKQDIVLQSTATERLFQAVRNVNYPTAAEVIGQSEAITDDKEAGQAGPSKSKKAISTITLKPTDTQQTISQRQAKDVKSTISRMGGVSSTNKSPVEVIIPENKLESGKVPWWKRIFSWEPHSTQTRPLYRDDAFYEGQIQKLSVYQKSMMVTSSEIPTGLEYQMAVSRAATVTDLEEKKGVFTTAVRRVLATMMDPLLLKRHSFQCLCMSGFFTYVGYLVPYVYIEDRNRKAGLDPYYCQYFVSVIGLSNLIGRVILGILASKIDASYLLVFNLIVAGLSTVISDFSHDVYYQYVYCVVFGFSISSLSCLRSVIIVSLYGLEKLTNATGMMLIFLGLGNLVSTPLAGLLKENFGYSVSFYTAGTFMLLSGLIVIPMNRFSIREAKKAYIVKT